MLPPLSTERLTLRPFRQDDAPTVARLANDPHILDVLFELPRPYRCEAAERWIAGHEQDRASGRSHVFALCMKGSDTPVGAATLERESKARGTLGYWIGRPHRGQGLASEAVSSLVLFGFDVLELDRIEARHLDRNTASGRVLAKAGLVREVTLRDYIRNPHTGALEDMVQWITLASEKPRNRPVDGRRSIIADDAKDKQDKQDNQSMTHKATGSRLATVALIVPEYDKARDWFVERLGFTLVTDHPLPEAGKDGRPKRWVVVAPPGGGAHLLLARADSSIERKTIGRQGAGRVWLFLETDDFARDRARYEAAGVEFTERTRRERYGTVAVFRDLVGNRWDLIERRLPE